MEKQVSCSVCGTVMKSENEACPACGSNEHLISVLLSESLEISENIGMKVKDQTRQGKAKVRRRIKIEEDKGIYWLMDVNLDDNSYFEEVRDKQFNKIIHYCSEPLSQHRGHGSAKKKK